MKINSNWLKLVRDRWKSVLESLPGLRFNEFVIDGITLAEMMREMYKAKLLRFKRNMSLEREYVKTPDDLPTDINFLNARRLFSWNSLAPFK